MPPGRPSKWDDSLKKLIEYMAKQGKTDRQMAFECGVTEQTFNNWKIAHPDFFESLKGWKESADESVETSLYERAKGYSTTEVKVMQDKHGRIIEHEIVKHYPPDPTSMIYWLKNRQPKKWRDKREVEHTGETKIKIDKQDEEL